MLIEDKEIKEIVSAIKESLEGLVKTIKIATWLMLTASLLAVVLFFLLSTNQLENIYPETQKNKPQSGDLEIKQKIFNECFDYYAETNLDVGISIDTIKICKDKAEDWINQLSIQL